MNRRELIKLAGSTAIGLAGTSLATTAVAEADAADPAGRPAVERWGVFEASFRGPSDGNPFVNVQLSAEFRFGNRSVRVSGFYDGEGTYRVRFMPDQIGDWTFKTYSNVAALSGRAGRFTCIAASAENHGPVKVSRGRHFCHADGRAFFPFGTTCYAWVHQAAGLQEETLKTLADAPFNKIRMLVFPKSYEYNRNEPPFYPFPRKDGVNDLSTFNVEFFRHYERRIQDLGRLGIQADVILFHPYDRWGYSKMPPEADDRYLRYVIARFSAFQNVWWSLANEYDLVKSKSAADWDRFAHILQEEDPHHHLRSVHYSRVMYDYSRQWVTHASLQTYDFTHTKRWFKEWNKPIIFDECQYEGNIPSRWGNLPGEEMTRRFWLAIVAGCYATHGETYLDPSDMLWWSKGGVLRGSSPERIGFLRRIAEEAGTSGLAAANEEYYLNASAGDDLILYYFDYHQPKEYKFELPNGISYRGELIDPWNMKVTPVDGVFRETTNLTLPGRPYQAIRFKKVI